MFGLTYTWNNILELVSITHVVAYVLVVTRITGLMLVAPFFGERMYPRRTKVLLSAVLGLLVFMGSGPQVAALPGDNFLLVLAVASELVIGLAMGFVVLLMFQALYFAGSMIGMDIGMGIANQLDPFFDAQVSLVAQFKYIFGLVVFLGLDGHVYLLGEVMRSFEIIPVGGLTLSAVTAARVTDYVVVESFARMLLVAVKIATPVFAVLIIITVASGFIARVMPQINIMVVAMPLRIMVGMSALMMALPLALLFISAYADSPGSGQGAAFEARTVLELLSPLGSPQG